MTTDFPEIGETVKSTSEAIHVRRAFSEPYELDGALFIPVARVVGGGGGGGGGGTDDAGSAGSGFGTGFGVNVSPVGIYRIQNGETTWMPAVDKQRIIEVLAVALTLVGIVWAWRR